MKIFLLSAWQIACLSEMIVPEMWIIYCVWILVAYVSDL